jgi:hypothetical protein
MSSHHGFNGPPRVQLRAAQRSIAARAAAPLPTPIPSLRPVRQTDDIGKEVSEEEFKIFLDSYRSQPIERAFHIPEKNVTVRMHSPFIAAGCINVLF